MTMSEFVEEKQRIVAQMEAILREYFEERGGEVS
jgi:hypothetical protein